MSKFDLWPSRNNPSSDSTKSYLWYVVYVIPKSFMQKKEKKLLNSFWEKWSNKPKMSKFWPLTFKKQPFEWFNQILLMICCLCHPKEASCKKIKKVIETVLRKWSNKPKMSKFDLWPSRNNPSSDSTKSYLWYVVYVIQRSFMQKKKKSYWTVFEKINFKICPIWPMLIFRPPKPPVRVIESH